jgi:hypothetical protein
VGVARHIALLAAVVLLAGCGGAGHQASSQPTRTLPDTAIAPVTRTPVRPPPPTGPRDAPVPILMYHVIAAPPAGTQYPDLWVGPRRFQHELAALAHAGFHGTTLGAVWRAWHGRGAMVRRPIVISFDDGYRSQSMAARRMLDHYGWPGVLNLQVDNVRLPGGIHRDEVQAMMRDGWEIDAHTITHPDLTTVDAARLHEEVAGSRAWIRRAFGVPAEFFAYPAGRYDPTVEGAVRSAGFYGATTTTEGIARPHDDPYALPRIRVTPDMTPSDVVSLARGSGPA